MEFAETLRQLLEQAFPGAAVEELGESTPGGRVGGVLIWPDFEGRDQVARQTRLWEVLRNNLSEEEQRRVSLIVTITPDELEAITAD